MMEQVRNKINIAQLYESQAVTLIHESTWEVSTRDTISYLENVVNKARSPKSKIRPMQILIKFMIFNIIREHCL